MEAASIPAGRPPRRRSRGLSERRLAAVMVSPSMIVMALVAAWPIAYAIWLSLHD
jgi:multiple sugar transport system permease protein